MNNPFTTTFSKIPDNSYIETNQYKEIIDNFNNDSPSESVYKITGVRGSGKTVLLSKVVEEMKNNKDWIIYNLSSSRNQLNQLGSYLYKDKFIKIKNKSKALKLNVNVLGNSGGFEYSNVKEDYIHDIGIDIEEGIKEIQKQNKKILIGIDEVMRTKDMIEFASEFGKWLICKYPVYLVCTGLYENINQLSNVKNLTFFRRATTVKTTPLNNIRMIEMYKNKLKINHETAKKMAEITKGYAYAFQELGVLYFKKKEETSFDEIISLLKTELYTYSYEKIWEELSDEDKSFLINIKDKNVYSRGEIIKTLGPKSNCYSVYRDRLLKKGLILSIDNCLSISLPFFGNYINEYCL